jgi:hypothetical protein
MADDKNPLLSSTIQEESSARTETFSFDHGGQGRRIQKMDEVPAEQNGGIISKFWSFCHECADTNALEAIETPEVYRHKLLGTSLEAVTVGVYAYWWDWLMHDVYCDFMFKCGCTWIFAGGWDDCNVHNASGPKCPYCTASASVAWTTTYLIQVVMFVTFLVMLKRRNVSMGFTTCWTSASKPHLQRFVRMIAAPTLMYFLAGAFVGWLFFLTNPHYYVFFLKP